MKKILIVLLSVLVLSCSKDEKDEYLVVGTCAIFPPFTYMWGNEHVGFDIEIAKIIAQDYGKELKMVNMNFSELIPSVEKGNIDMAISSMTITTARAQIIDFSESYYQASQSVIVRVEDLESYKNITTKEELGANKTLAAERDSTGAAAAKNISQGKPVLEDTFEIVVMDLLNKNIDAVIMDEVISKATASQYEELTTLNIEFEPEYYGIAIKKGNHALINSVNQTLNGLVASGDHRRLEENYVNSYFE